MSVYKFKSQSLASELVRPAVFLTNYAVLHPSRCGDIMQIQNCAADFSVYKSYIALTYGRDVVAQYIARRSLAAARVACGFSAAKADDN